MVGFGSVVIYTFGLFIKPLSAEFGWSRQTISTAFACASMTLGFCSPLLGHWIDRYGAPRVIQSCIAIFGLALMSLSLLNGSLVQLYGTFVVIGAVGNGTAQMGFARLISTWFVKRRGSALAIMMAGSGCGAIFIPVLCQHAIESYGWRQAYALFGLLPLLVGLPLMRFYIREHPHTVRQRVAAGAKGVLRQAATTRAFWFLLIMLFLAAMATTGSVTHMAALLTDSGVSAASAALAVSVLGLSSLCGRLLTGWILDRFFGGWVGLVLLSMTAAGMVLLANVRDEFSAVVAAVLIGFSMGGEMDITPYMLARYFGLEKLSTLYGFTWTAYAISAAAGSVILGKAFDTTGTYRFLLFQLAAMTLAAGILMAFMPKYPGRADESTLAVAPVPASSSAN